MLIVVAVVLFKVPVVAFMGGDTSAAAWGESFIEVTLVSTTDATPLDPI